MILKWILLCSVVVIVAPQKMVGYYPSWAHYRSGVWAFPAEKIDPKLYTHLIYAFAILNPSSYTIEVYDPWLDITLGGYKNFVALRNRYANVKLMIALGGWNDSLSNKYSIMASSPATISTFVNSVITFLDTYGFDGMDLDWEYPNAGDKVGFANLVKALRAAFGTKYELTLAVSASAGVISAGYDVPVISANVDAIHLMTYDYYGSWNFAADHHSPLYKRPSETDITANSDYTVNYWIARGASPSKLVLGIPVYGISWRLADASQSSPPTRGTGAGAQGPYTQEAGRLAYFEICTKIKGGGWTVVQDPDKRIGPYAYSFYEWVGYDDPAMAAYKTKYALDKGLGGAMIWDNSFDDFNNVCGEGVNPLQTAIYQALYKGNSTTSTPTPTTTSTSTSTTSKPTTTSTTTPTTTRQSSTTTKQTTTTLSTSTVSTTQPSTTTTNPTTTTISTTLPSTSTTKPTTTLSTTLPSTSTASSTTTRASTLTSSTPKPTSTTTKGSTFICPSDGLFRSPTNCAAFYSCGWGVATLMYCPSSLYFNPVTKGCDWQANVVCAN